MYEVTMQELGIFTALGFCCGIFASVFLARFFEVVAGKALRCERDGAGALRGSAGEGGSPQ